MTMAMEQDQNVERKQNIRTCALGVAFIVGLGIATVTNMMGYTGWAMGIGLIGVCCMVMFIFNINKM